MWTPLLERIWIKIRQNLPKSNLDLGFRSFIKEILFDPRPLHLGIYIANIIRGIDNDICARSVTY